MQKVLKYKLPLLVLGIAIAAAAAGLYIAGLMPGMSTDPHLAYATVRCADSVAPKGKPSLRLGPIRTSSRR